MVQRFIERDDVKAPMHTAPDPSQHYILQNAVGSARSLHGCLLSLFSRTNRII